MKPTTFEVLPNKAGRWFWHEKAANGRIVDVSQAYSTKSNAVRRARKQAARVPGAVIVIARARFTG